MPSPPFSPTRLLADIGGTNARFALAARDGIVAQAVYAVRAYPRLEDALQAFMAEQGAGATVQRAALAVAGPKLGDSIKPTNSDWVCDRTAVAALLGLETPQITLLNDFAAIAWALPGLSPDDSTVLQPGQPSPAHPMLVMGPGTGLGMAALVPHERHGSGWNWTAVATEAGMTRYAPANSEERRLIDQLARRHVFVTAETLISGPGLVNIYRALDADYDETPLEPAQIVERARADDPRAREALLHFAAIFGSFASAAALHYLALGGVYLTGGALQKLGADFAVDRFLQRFATNPCVSAVLARIPLRRVTADIPAFAGLQCLLDQDEQ